MDIYAPMGGKVIEVNKALEEFKTALKKSPDSPLLLYAVAQGYFFQDEFEQCIETCDKILSLQPENLDALLIQFSEQGINGIVAADVGFKGMFIDPLQLVVLQAVYPQTVQLVTQLLAVDTLAKYTVYYNHVAGIALQSGVDGDYILIFVGRR